MPGQTYRSHDTYRESKTYEGIGPGGGTGPLDSYFLPLSEDRVPNREILAMRGITVPSRRYLQFLKQQVGTDVDGLGGITIGGVHYDGGRWNGPLSATQIAALGAAGLSGRIVQAALPGDLPADIGLTKPGGGGSKGGGGGGDKGGGGGGGGGAFPCPGGISIPSSITADESIDVTGALNAFFNGLPPNAIVCCDPAAKYLLTGTLDIDLTGKGSLTVNQNGALFHWPTLGPLINGISQRNHVKITNGTPIWNDLNILGPYGSTTRPVFSHTYEGENGLILAGTHDAVITRPVIHGTAGDGMGTSKYHPPVGPTVFCTNTRILFPTVGSCAGGFADSHGSEVGPLYIEDGDFRHISRSGLDFEYPASNIFIRRNRFADLGLSWVAMAGIGVLSTIEISDNVVEDAPLFAKVGPGPGTYATGGRDSGFLIQRNQSLVVVSPGLGPVMSFKGVSDVTMIGNIQHFSAPRSAGAIQPAGTVAPLDVNYHAQGNDFAGVGTLYASPTDPTWFDDGGNIL